TIFEIIKGKAKRRNLRRRNGALHHPLKLLLRKEKQQRENLPLCLQETQSQRSRW
ncbi:unnamed protein product, partial [Larinioides sclopetarius]